MIRGVEPNPGPKADQEKIDQIIVNLRNQEKESKDIRSLLETRKQEMKEINDAYRDIGKKNFDKLR